MDWNNPHHLGAIFHSMRMLLQSNMPHLITTKNVISSSAIRTSQEKKRSQFLKSIKCNAFCSRLALTKPQSISPARKSLLPLSGLPCGIEGLLARQSIPQGELFLISKKIKKPCPLTLREDFVRTNPSLLSFNSANIFVNHTSSNEDKC